MSNKNSKWVPFMILENGANRAINSKEDWDAFMSIYPNTDLQTALYVQFDNNHQTYGQGLSLADFFAGNGMQP